MADANVIFQNLFPGAGYPSYETVWPDFEVVTGNPPFATPVVDGKSHGMGSRTLSAGATNPWRLRSDYFPGRLNYKADLELRWEDPESGINTVGLILSFIDYNNFLVARLASGGGGGTPSLKMYKVIAGTATQLGSTYSGFSNSNLFAGLKLRFRREDLEDGSGLRLTVYRDPEIDDNGTSVIDVTATGLGKFNAGYTAGIELIGCKNTAIRITSLTCYDFGDEWTPSEDPTLVGLGWQFEFGDTLYSLADLHALEPRVCPKNVQMGYGPNGREAMVTVEGDFRDHTFVYPGQSYRVFHNNVCRFAGWISEADQSLSPGQEQQNFRARDGIWAARQVVIQNDDLVGNHYFNVYAPRQASGEGGTEGVCATEAGDNVPDEWDAELQDMTIGDIIAWLFDRYTDGNEKLRFYGAAPASGDAYDSAELALMTAIMPDLRVSGNFMTAIQSLMKYMPTFQMIMDPITKIWHFYDVTAETAATVTFPTDIVPSVKFKPDPDKSYTAVVWRGSKRNEKDPVTMKLSDGTLRPAWNSAQEAVNHADKKHKARITITIDAAGELPPGSQFRGVTYPALQYLSISIADAASLGIEDDDFRGAYVMVNGWARWVIGNTSTRFYLSVPNWVSPPAAGTQYVIALNDDPCAIEELSGNMVGMAFHGVGAACGIPDESGIAASLYKSNSLKNKGRCGTAKVVGQGLDGQFYAQQYEYTVKQLTGAAQEAFGICGPVISLSKPAAPPTGLLNRLPPKGGSAPKTNCVVGNSQRPSQMPQVDIEVQLSLLEDEVAYQRYPPEGYHGEAFSENDANWDGAGQPEPGDWRCRNVLIIDDPDFRDLSIQGPGILLAQQAIIDLFGQKAYTVDVELVTPWNADYGHDAALSSRFGSFPLKLRLESTQRTLGFEAANFLPIFEVVFNIESNTTQLRAGTPVAWAGVDPKTVSASYVDKNLLKKMADKIKEVEDYRNALLGHSPRRIGASTPTIDGCTVLVMEQVTKQRKDVTTIINDKDKKIHHLSMLGNLSQMMNTGVQTDNPGAQVAMPGLSGAASKMPKRSAAVLESLADARVLDQGPVSGTKVNGDRSHYGGLIGADDIDAGQPPVILAKMGPYAFRTKPDKVGEVYGGHILQYSALDSDGNETTWTDMESPTDMPNGHIPLSVITAGSLLDTIKTRIESLEENLGLVIDTDLERSINPGSEDNAGTVYPDGAPADLLTVAMAMAKIEGSVLLQSTLRDPGGAVFTGSKTEAGLDSETFWRVAMPEKVIVQVEAVTAGTGTNGGNWDYVVVDDAYVYADIMRIEHKQAHAPALDTDKRSGIGACSAPATDDSPFGFDNSRGVVLDPSSTSGAGHIFPLAKGSHGIPTFEVVATELLSDAAAPGLNHALAFSYSYKASAWTAISTGTPGTAVTSDGSGEAVGQYKAPGGAVPPGLRVPSDAATLLALSAYRNPGAGTDTASGESTVVVGLSVNVAVVEGGIWIRIRGQNVDVADALVHNHPQKIEAVDESEVWVLDFTKASTEAVTVRDTVSVELNPPVVDELLVEAEDGVVLDTTKALTDGAEIEDLVTTELNP